MIRLRATSSFTNSDVFWTDSNAPYTGSTIALNLTSSYSGKTYQVFGDVTSAKYSGFGSWILFNTDGNFLPSASGQYDVSIYGAVSGSQITWGLATKTFTQGTNTWGNVLHLRAIGQFLSEDRVFISGSNYDAINQYNYQDEPVYSVYNG